MATPHRSDLEFETLSRQPRNYPTCVIRPYARGTVKLDYSSTDQWRYVADAVLIVHIGVAAFLIAGQVAIIAGGILNVRWVRNLWFRVVHLGLIVFIAGQSMLGRICPLTNLEQYLRALARQPSSHQTTTQARLFHLLFFDAPSWVFIAAHSLAALVILVTWFAVPPIWYLKKRADSSSVTTNQPGPSATSAATSGS